jgi:NADH dehydrogenase
MTRHQVVVVGGGFGGLQVVRHLARAEVEVTLLDRRNFHLFQPLLYQVATGTLSPANIAFPLRTLFKRQGNARVLLGEASGIDLPGRSLRLADGASLRFDTLVVAAGARHHYFGHPAWEADAPGLKGIEDATAIRRRIFSAFERAEREDDEARRRAALTFVVVGGGPTGVELAGTLAEIARHTMAGEFRRIDPGQARIILVQGNQRVLPGYHGSLSQAAADGLARLGVAVRFRAHAVAVDAAGVTVQGSAGEERIAADTVLWAAGVQAAPIGHTIAAAAGAACDQAGRVQVGPDCALPGQPGIFVIGDLATLGGADGNPLPGVAQVAMQQGAYVAKLIRARLDGGTLPPFRYRDLGSMATIGRGLAVAEIGRWRLTGVVAWLAWLFVHLMQLVSFENRLLVLVQWGWCYLTWNRNARLITFPGLGGRPDGD